MKWHVAFFLKNLPAIYRVSDEDFIMAGVAEENIRMFLDGFAEVAHVQRFFTELNEHKITAVLFRLEAEDESKALILARHRLESFIDALAITLDRNLPVVCSLAEIREESAPDAAIFEMIPDQWAYFEPPAEGSKAEWEERQRRVFQDLMPFFDVASGAHAQRDTSLSRQLLYAMKMYRAGAQTGDFGLEFLCRWSALESLVCGGETKKKGELLRDRLPRLMPGPTAESQARIQELWRYRSQAVHEALAFRSDHLVEAPPLAVNVEQVERMFLAVVLFAVGHLDKAPSIKALWDNHTAGYQVPPHVFQDRPAGMYRYAIRNVNLNTRRGVLGGGKQFDAAFAGRVEKQPDAVVPQALE